MKLSNILKPSFLRDKVLERALSKIEGLGIPPKEAVHIIRDSQINTDRMLPNISLDEAGALVHYVVGFVGIKRKLLAAVGVVMTLVSGWMGGTLVAPTEVLNTTPVIPLTTLVVLPDDKKVALQKYINLHACENSPCTVQSVSRDAYGGWQASYKDGDLDIKMSIPSTLTSTLK